MDPSLEIIIAVLSPTVVILLFVWKMYSELIQRMTKVETNVNFMLKWIVVLNGEMNDKKEFKEFLEQLKEVAKGKGL